MRVKNLGTVYLVGAGPGDPGLLTLRGADLLRRAEVVLYDRLVNPTLLQLAPAQAEIIARGSRSECSQEKIIECMIERAKSGKCVVRLKGGDPYVFGRGGEEAEALAEAGIPFEVVPGVSSITAVPNYAGIPLTHRNHCSSFTVITGHQNGNNTDAQLQFQHLAGMPGTKVVLMGLENMAQWTQNLIQSGIAAQTPVAVIQSGTCGSQKTITGTLETIAHLVEGVITPPALTILGSVVSLRHQLNWAENRPLSGRRIVVTRALNQAESFNRRLVELGAEVLCIPTVRIENPQNRGFLVDALLSLNTYDWLVFTSANGVDRFFEYFLRQFKDLRDLGGAKIAAVGPATAARLEALHLQVDAMPEEHIGHKIAESMGREGSIENLKVCLLRAEKAGKELPQALEEMGAIVDDIGLYQTIAETDVAQETIQDLKTRGADWLTFTSGSTATFFHERLNLPSLLDAFPEMRVASIGPETTKCLAGMGVKMDLEAREHTMDGLLKAILKAENRPATRRLK